MRVLLDQIVEPSAPLRAQISQESIQELAASFLAVGQLQPIGVLRRDDGLFEIVYGHRRFLAAQWLRWKDIEAVLVADESDMQLKACQLIENCQRQDLSPLEEAYALLELSQSCTGSIRELAAITGKSQSWVRSRLELLEYPEDLQRAVQLGQISLGVAGELAKLEQDSIRGAYLNAAIESGVSVAQAQVWVQSALLASSGVAAAMADESQQLELSSEPQVVDQQYHCFICGELYSWRKVNTLIICGQCQEAVAQARKGAV
jgi:ParB family chromosome partitioning protein